MRQYTLVVGQTYKRSEIKAALGLDPQMKGGPWDTGYAERNGADFIFCNVGSPGRTGHDYDNFFDGGDLVWRGKTNSHKGQPTIRRMTAPDAEVHVFWRADERDPFTYAGLGKAVDVTDEVPVRVRWRFGERYSNGDSRSQERLPVEVLNTVSPEYVWSAVQKLLSGYGAHQFGESTDYDLIADDGIRLAPKAVFGVAASLALGFEVLPKHFSGGEGSPCFRLLRSAGYDVVGKNEPAHTTDTALSNEEQEWAEGRAVLVRHLLRERARGLSPAKKAQFKREHGKLYCERCGLDPVDHYQTQDGEACIEVHHHAVQVQDMPEDHRTRLDAVQCLCANCHRLVHRLLKKQVRPSNTDPAAADLLG